MKRLCSLLLVLALLFTFSACGLISRAGGGSSQAPPSSSGEQHNEDPENEDNPADDENPGENENPGGNETTGNDVQGGETGGTSADLITDPNRKCAYHIEDKGDTVVFTMTYSDGLVKLSELDQYQMVVESYFEDDRLKGSKTMTWYTSEAAAKEAYDGYAGSETEVVSREGNVVTVVVPDILGLSDSEMEALGLDASILTKSELISLWETTGELVALMEGMEGMEDMGNLF